MNWYGLVVDGELKQVKEFDTAPSIDDFGYFYDATDISIQVVKIITVVLDVLTRALAAQPA